MANDEHVRRLLDEGVEAWNAWREAKPDVRPDLSDANLSRTQLRNANLIYANLSRVQLRNTDLRNSILSADLSYANLSRAQLGGTIFAFVNLTTVDGLETCNHQGPSSLPH